MQPEWRNTNGVLFTFCYGINKGGMQSIHNAHEDDYIKCTQLWGSITVTANEVLTGLVGYKVGNPSRRD